MLTVPGIYLYSGGLPTYFYLGPEYKYTCGSAPTVRTQKQEVTSWQGTWTGWTGRDHGLIGPRRWSLGLRSCLFARVSPGRSIVTHSSGRV